MAPSEGETGIESAANAAAMVAYADRAIVSRVLTKGPSGTLTVFAFDAGQEISEHTTPHEAFAFGLDGVLEFTVGGTRCPLGTGDILRLPAGVPHALRAQGRAKMLLVMFKTG
jgi:quercetin dioxygenase-like cupin family protein